MGARRKRNVVQKSSGFEPARKATEQIMLACQMNQVTPLARRQGSQ